MTTRTAATLASVLAAAATAAGLVSRPLLPVDETRYLSVAWEMLGTGQWLVPHLNGAPYSHKPPLLFWLIAGGWRLLGASATWGRLVAPLFGIVALWLTSRLARALWPEREGVAVLAPLVLAGSLLWTVYGTLTMFDTMLTVGVLVALLGLAMSAGGRARGGWALVTLGTGFALHAKGPVAFVHLLPAALLAPWWALRGRSERWSGWFARLGLALLGGSALVLAWAIPAALAGGKEFGAAIFLGQTAGRVVQSFAHRRPLWWYLPILPAMVLPWLLWPRLWRGFAALASGAPEAGVRFCAAWALPALAVFSLVSGKQMHYLLPLIPAFALVAARALDGAADAGGVALPAARLAVAAVVTVIALQAAASRELHRRYDLAGVAALAQRLERSGRPIAHAGNYAGQYHFLGRLRRPFAILHGDTAAAWLGEHPDGAVITDARRGGCRPVAGARLLLEHAAEGSKTICVWEAAATPAPAVRPPG